MAKVVKALYYLAMRYFQAFEWLGAEFRPRHRQRVRIPLRHACGLAFVPEGRLYLKVDDRPRVVFNRPVVFWHHPEHRYEVGPVDEAGWAQYWLRMAGMGSRRILEEGFMELAPKGFTYPHQPNAIRKEFDDIVSIVKNRIPWQHRDSVLSLERILCSVSDTRRFEEGGPPVFSAIDRLAQAIRSDPLKTRDFAAEARRMPLSYSRFRHLFKERIGEAPYEYQLGWLMTKACAALHADKRQIKDIAAECGYEDAALFCRVFKRRIGLSPSQFRKTIVSSRRE